MFEEMEKVGDKTEMAFAPQNHPTVFLSFVWDATQGAEGDESLQG